VLVVETLGLGTIVQLGPHSGEALGDEAWATAWELLMSQITAIAVKSVVVQAKTRTYWGSANAVTVRFIGLSPFDGLVSPDKSIIAERRAIRISYPT